MGLRTQRLEKQFLQELTMLMRGLKDPELAAFVTLTDISVARDLKTCQVYWSVLGSAEDKAGTARALERSKGFLRSALAGKVHVRHMPELSFHYDDTPERADRIDRIINKLEQERIDHPPPAPSDEPEPGTKEDRR